MSGASLLPEMQSVTKITWKESPKTFRSQYYDSCYIEIFVRKNRYLKFTTYF